MTADDAPTTGLLQQRAFVLFAFARLTSTMGYYMLVIAISWKIYDLTGSAFDLGLVGLIQFVPAMALTLLIGHFADRYDRRVIIRAAQGVQVLAAAIVTVGLLRGALTRELLFGVVFLLGCARAFELPTAGALVPSLVPPRLISRAVAAWTSANQTAVICGPALGGLLYSIDPILVSTLCIAFVLVAIACVTLVPTRPIGGERQPFSLSSVLAGFRFILERRRLLGVITLDLVVVLLGGATALLPIFARDILESGPLTLGLLRSAPAVGALLTATVLARFPVERHVGPVMFAAVAIFGLSTIVFALSTSLPLSLFALFVLGASDAVSVVIRFSLVQIETPDDKRGRVSAINYLFVGTSNTLGEFESGAVAAWLGAVPSAFIGGLGSLLVAGIWMGLFPELRRLDRQRAADAGPPPRE